MPIVGWRLVVREDGWSSNSNPGETIRRTGAGTRTARSDALIERVG
jgi:hypothetical protein